MAPLPHELRRLLENVIVAARDAAEDAARAALRALSVDREEAHTGISDDDRALRVALRARARQLGDFDLLVAEVAYEQWHRMLFARFLGENDLLMHPSGVAVTLAECADMADSEGEPDAWMLAARYASAMLPGIFRVDDPSVRVRFARNDIATLERLLTDLPGEAFIADDSLGWVYQYWQSKRKKQVNAAQKKISGVDLPPVTQLFTEHYMVAFLLENSLGAWWAARRPDSPLLQELKYLRLDETGEPTAGRFSNWPESAADITLMDPSCGSGHFLVTALEMLRRMREEEEGLAPGEAADAVLRENLFGLELDGRCVQIAVFALALAAWKVGGYRQLPAMNVACSGVPARGSAAEWRAVAQGDGRLADALERLFFLFNDADTLGSLVDPRRAAETDTLLGVDFDEVAPAMHAALRRYGGDDPAQQVFARAADEVTTAATMLGDTYTLVVTNPPYLGRGAQSEVLADFCLRFHGDARQDLGTVFLDRMSRMLGPSGVLATVTPQYWLFLTGYRSFRKTMLNDYSWRMCARLGAGAFSAITGEVVQPVLSILWRGPRSRLLLLDAGSAVGPTAKDEMLQRGEFLESSEEQQLGNPDSVVAFAEPGKGVLLSTVASFQPGTQTGDDARYRRTFWELPGIDGVWRRFQTAERGEVHYGGRCHVARWPGVNGVEGCEGAVIRGRKAWGKTGIAVSRAGNLPVTLYTGDAFSDSATVVLPAEEEDILSLYAYLRSDSYVSAVRAMNTKLLVTNSALLAVPFDLEHWSEVAAKQYSDGLPQPHSDDPTQWLYGGGVSDSHRPLHAGIARLFGYRWPEQAADGLDDLADSDGIVCLSPVAGERSASDRVRDLLAEAYGPKWSESVLDRLLREEGGSDLETWLRDSFFSGHAKLFHNRPFIWHIWDGRRDGFSALVNYHKLDKRTLEKLTYSTLQWWIDRQRAETASGSSGSEARLAAAVELQGQLARIIEGEPPYDIYVRWKSLSAQPVGWDPDLDDGVRVNIRPFMRAGVLRPGVTVDWKKDRGTNPDGSARENDLSFTVSEKLTARGEH